MRYQLACILWAAAFISGCGQQSATNLSDGSQTTVSFNAAGAPTVAISMPDMMCPDGCGATAREVLSAQPGVKEVLIDFDSKQAMVAVDSDSFDPTAALAALVDRGFIHSAVQSPEAKPAAQPVEPSAEAQPAG
jgi:copper chaperone CopZ